MNTCNESRKRKRDSFESSSSKTLSKDGHEARAPPAERTMVHLHNFTQHLQLKFLVGPDVQEFFMFRDALCQESDFIKAICNRQQRDPTILILNHHPETFGIFLSWAWANDIMCAEKLVQIPKINPRRSQFRTALKSQFKQLLNCYVLGEKLKAKRFQNDLTDMLVNLCDIDWSQYDESVLVKPKYLAYAWTMTPDGSPLRKLLLDHVMSMKIDIIDMMKSCTGDGYFEILRDLGFVQEVLDGLEAAERVGKTATSPADAWLRCQCVYHEHPGDRIYPCVVVVD